MGKLNPDKHSSIVIIILTLFAAVGSVSIDIFTPSLPAISDFFATTPSTAQWSVGLFMLGFSLSTLIAGPLADNLGRKKTLLLGYTIYLVSTVIILLTDSIYWFNTARFCQGLFGCFGTVLARIIAHDYYQDRMKVKILAYIGGSLMIAPMAAPILGGYLQEHGSWQYSFYIMALMAVIAMASLLVIPEKKPSTSAESVTRYSLFREFKIILTDLEYLRFTIAAGTAFSGAFVFVVGGAFVFIDQLEVSPAHYGYLFATAIAGYLLSAFLGPKLIANISQCRSFIISCSLLVAGSIISLLTSLFSEGQSILGYVAGITVYELGLGLFMPLCQARATEHIKSNIGVAAGLIFFIEMLLATLISALLSFMPENGTLSLAIVTMVSIVFTCLCFVRTDSRETHIPKNSEAACRK